MSLSSCFPQAGYEDGTVALWDLRSHSRPLHYARLHSEAVLGIAVDGKARGAASVGADGALNQIALRPQGVGAECMQLRKAHSYDQGIGTMQEPVGGVHVDACLDTDMMQSPKPHQNLSRYFSCVCEQLRKFLSCTQHQELVSHANAGSMAFTEAQVPFTVPFYDAVFLSGCLVICRLNPCPPSALLPIPLFMIHSKLLYVGC